jgi:hypothetical protein
MFDKETFYNLKLANEIFLNIKVITINETIVKLTILIKIKVRNHAV